MRTYTKIALAAFALLSAEKTQAQYCMLPGRTAYASEQPGITTFKLNTIDRLSLNLETPLSNPPISVTGDSTILQRGKKYKVTIIHTRDAINFPNASNNIRLWIDYNQNFSFTDTKETAISKDYIMYGTYVDSFTVPVDAPLGPTRLRVTAKMSSDAGHTIPTSCDDPKDPLGYHGEMEDYKVIIAAPTTIEDARHAALNIAVYPNPTAGELTLSFNSTPSEPVSVWLYDITGKQISCLLNNTKVSSPALHINLNDHQIAKGIYFIKVSAGDAAAFQKLIKID